jgi:adenylyl-sulfate kinase
LTIARHVADILRRRGHAVELLEGEEMRQSLSRGLGFSRDDREEHLRRMGYVAKLLSRNGVIVLCAAVSPYRSSRDEIRSHLSFFVEVFVDCPVRIAEERDTAGVYARARAGEIEQFTGISAPYEKPIRPEVHVRTERESVHEAGVKVVRTLEVLEMIPTARGLERVGLADEDDLRRRLAGLGYL